ncbi:MAG: trypsin-like peptidase domain-containing protein [Planctomycetota bacterium]|jgi:S1-C subfamily serine protease
MIRIALTGLLLGLAAAALHADVSIEEAVKQVRALEKQRVDLAARLAPAVCAVFKGGGGGSGVIITPDGLALSNFHVTELESEMRIGLNDNRIHPAVVLGVDPSGDLSLLRLKEKRTWTFAPLGDSDALHQGDWVYAMGNPFLLATDFTPTITLGVVSGINRYQPGSMRGTLLYPDCIQTDASINPGNSGGPLFNFSGEVVGINGRVSLRERGRVNIGVGYAISSNQIKLCLPELRAGKIVEHGTLNATVRSIDDPTWPGGVRIVFDQMLAPGAAHGAGIQVGDVLDSFQGVRIRNSNEFLRLISVLPKGRKVTVAVKRLDDRGDKWEEKSFRIVLDGIPLIRKSDAAKKETPRTYIEQEIERTFTAARKALAPITDETRKGTLKVRGRDPKPWTETHAAGKHTFGAAGVAVSEEKQADFDERAAAWNDLVTPDNAAAGIEHLPEAGARLLKRFKSVDFTGGALVNGVTADRIEVESKDGNKRVYFVDLDTGRLLRCDLYSQAWVRWISLYYDDWRDAGGLLRPYKVTIWDRDKESLFQTITYEAIQRR